VRVTDDRFAEFPSRRVGHKIEKDGNIGSGLRGGPQNPTNVLGTKTKEKRSSPFPTKGLDKWVRGGPEKAALAPQMNCEKKNPSLIFGDQSLEEPGTLIFWLAIFQRVDGSPIKKLGLGKEMYLIDF